jgi:hypothetical protein
MYVVVIYWYIINKNNSVDFVNKKCFLYTEDFLNVFDVVFHVQKHATYWVSSLSVLFIRLATSMEFI